MIQPTLINLHPNKCNHEFDYYLFKLDRFVGSCNTLNNLCNRVCVPNKTEDFNLSLFNMMTQINEWKHLQSIHHVNVNLNLMEENVIQINGGMLINVDVNEKNVMYVKFIFGIPLHVIVKMENI